MTIGRRSLVRPSIESTCPLAEKIKLGQPKSLVVELSGAIVRTALWVPLSVEPPMGPRSA
eukprot:4640383-Pyramimonas_sp.AAC.1